MPIKPTEQEEEYFARLDFERREMAIAFVIVARGATDLRVSPVSQWTIVDPLQFCGTCATSGGRSRSRSGRHKMPGRHA